MSSTDLARNPQPFHNIDNPESLASNPEEIHPNPEDLVQFDEDDLENSIEKKIYTKDYDLHQIRFSTKERLVEGVEEPIGHEISDNDFWLQPNKKPNCVAIKEHLRREGKISIVQFTALIDAVYEIFCAEENILEVDAPVTVCGDVHGQYYDLLKLLEVGGDPATTNYLLLGDYVDRGLFSMECVILMFCYKLSYPDTFFMLRGNHECRHLTDYFTFREECDYKYSRDIYDSIMDCFDALPLAAVMNKQFFLCSWWTFPRT
jgi:serine/threonine-protein phosphatase 2B catalytic subunit